MGVVGSRPHATTLAGTFFVALWLALCPATRASADPLPGADPFPPELALRLERAASAAQAEPSSGRGDAPPKYTNRLALEASPYLLQHAHNPVDWYPWGDEAFARAMHEGKPVLLSIGYSSCHWCHVMEQESFDDVEIATFLNQHYVAIKVDRELRPDVDSIYQAAARKLGVGGGWPLTVWLMPDRRPFYAGTYFPPRSGVRGAPTGFLELLERLRAAYRERPDRVTEAAAGLARELARSSPTPTTGALPRPRALSLAYERLAASFDEAHGGFGAAPKFPNALDLSFLLRYHRRTQDSHALAMVEATLAAMAAGGIRDQVGGGFHRYAIDRAWRIPHFEKMLYDNALLASVYLEAYQVTRRDDFAAVARGILAHLARDMQAKEGGFFAATDADSEGGEGRFYTWTPAEIDRAVGEERLGRLLRAYYGVGDAGNLGGRSVLAVQRPLSLLAAELAIPEAEAAIALEEGRRRLLRARQARVAPHTDRKLVAAWNGLAISAFSRAALVLREPVWAEIATRSAACVRDRLSSPSRGGRGARLRRALYDGRAEGDGFLDDYAFAIAGLLDLFEVSRDLDWLRFALSLQDELDARFWDADAGGYFLTGDEQEWVLVREKPLADGAEPSGNSVAVANLQRLHALTGEARFLERAERTLRTFTAAIEQEPNATPGMLAALDFHSDRAKEIVIVTARPEDEPAAFLDAVARGFLPNRVLAVVSEGAELQELARLVPLVANKTARGGRPTAYVCERWVCRQPTVDPEVFARQLAAVERLPESASPGE